MQQSRTRAFQSKKDTGECFSTKLKGTCKNSGTFEGKKFYPKKSRTSLLHQAIQLHIGIPQSLPMLHMADVCNGGGQHVFWMLSGGEMMQPVQFDDNILWDQFWIRIWSHLGLVEFLQILHMGCVYGREPRWAYTCQHTVLCHHSAYWQWQVVTPMVLDLWPVLDLQVVSARPPPWHGSVRV